MSLRTQIADKLVSLFSNIKKSNGYNTDVVSAQRKLLFYDEIDVRPSIVLTGGAESRVYHPSQTKERIITYIVRAYVNSETNSDGILDGLIDDIESAVDNSFITDRLGGLVTNITIQEITTDEGLLAPDAVAEMVFVATII